MPAASKVEPGGLRQQNWTLILSHCDWQTRRLGLAGGLGVRLSLRLVAPSSSSSPPGQSEAQSQLEFAGGLNLPFCHGYFKFRLFNNIVRVRLSHIPSQISDFSIFVKLSLSRTPAPRRPDS